MKPTTNPQTVPVKTTWLARWSALALLVSTTAASQASITITFDYSYDSSGFFTTHAEAVTTLEAARDDLVSRLGDSLAGIPSPTGDNYWTADFFHPATGLAQSLMNLLVPADTLIIYVGARDLSGGTAGQASAGYGYSADNQGWVDTVVKRGQAGATEDALTSTDFGPWGGSIAFDTTLPDATDRPWYFDATPATVDVPAGETDFYSVALHEIGHLLGIGSAPSWEHWVDGANKFTGPVSVAEFGVSIDLDPGASHWIAGTMSTLPGTATSQETAMDPDLTGGTRKFFTDLDWAGLDDIGWDVTPVPEPQHYALVAGLGLLAFGTYRRRRGTFLNRAR